MKYLLAFLGTLSIFCVESTSAQTGKTLNEFEKGQFFLELEALLVELDPVQYRAQMLFQQFGSDTLEVRNFAVNYRTNSSNQLYGYDYEITEFRNHDTRKLMALNKSFFVIITGADKKIVSERTLPNKVHYGSYFEYIRTNFILSEVLFPFLSASLNAVSVIDSNDNYYVSRQMNDLAERRLVINKKTHLPRMWASVIKSQDFDLAQTLAIHFTFDQEMNTLPTSAFSIQEYLAAGHEHIISIPDTSIAKSALPEATIDKKNALLDYPFVLPQGDTVLIKDRTSKYILLDFWFASCLPCLKAWPELNRLAEAYSNSGLEVLGINCFDMGIKENLSMKLRDENIRIPLLFGSRDLTESLGVRSFPTYYLLTPDRKLVLIDGGVEEVKQTIEQMFRSN